MGSNISQPEKQQQDRETEKATLQQQPHVQQRPQLLQLRKTNEAIGRTTLKTVPAKRQGARLSDDVDHQRKRLRRSNPHPQTPRCDTENAKRIENDRTVDTRKRQRATDSENGPPPTKRLKPDSESGKVDCGFDATLLQLADADPGEAHDFAPQTAEIDAVNEEVCDFDGHPTSKTRLNAETTDAPTLGHPTAELGSLLRTQKKQPALALRQKQQSYERTRRAAQQKKASSSAACLPHDGSKGLRLLLDSAKIPGSLRGCVTESDSIELPKKIPSRVSQNSPTPISGSRARAHYNKAPWA